MNYILSKELKNMLKELNKLYKLSYIELKQEVDYIINNNIKDTILIEHTLDSIINIPTEESYLLLIKLCNYVKTINKELSDDYLKIYKEIYGDEDPPKKKKKK